jgi:hypothetical protein
MIADYLSHYPDYKRAISGMDAVAGVKRYRCDDGASCGMRVAEVYTAAGLRYTVLLDRGMDIGEASFRGVPVSFNGKGGVFRADYAQSCTGGFAQSFHAGLLYTCGLDNVGAPCEYNGKLLPQPGSRTFLPAYDVCCSEAFEGDDYVLRVRGKMRQASIFGENILLTREIVSRAASATITVTDTIENQGSSDYEYMLLYHCNFGFPLVSADSRVTTNHTKASFFETNHAYPRVPQAAEYQGFTEAQKTFSEFVFKLQEPTSEKISARVENPRVGIAAELRCDVAELPCFTQWVNLAEQDYVLGLEPGTHYPAGRAKVADKAARVAPLGTRQHSVTITIEEL